MVVPVRVIENYVWWFLGCFFCGWMWLREGVCTFHAVIFGFVGCCFIFHSKMLHSINRPVFFCSARCFSLHLDQCAWFRVAPFLVLSIRLMHLPNYIIHGWCRLLLFGFIFFFFARTRLAFFRFLCWQRLRIEKYTVKKNQPTNIKALSLKTNTK